VTSRSYVCQFNFTLNLVSRKIPYRQCWTKVTNLLLILFAW